MSDAADKIAHDMGVRRAMRAFPAGVPADGNAELRFVLDAATRNVGLVYTPPLALEPQKVVVPFVIVKELCAQVSIAEAQTAIALYEQHGLAVPPGLQTKLAAAQLMAREVMAERDGTERFPIVVDDTEVKAFVAAHAGAKPAAPKMIPGFDV